LPRPIHLESPIRPSSPTPRIVSEFLQARRFEGGWTRYRGKRSLAIRRATPAYRYLELILADPKNFDLDESNPKFGYRIRNADPGESEKN